MPVEPIMPSKKTIDKDVDDIKKYAKNAHTRVHDIFKHPIPDVISLKHSIPDYTKAIDPMINIEEDVKLLLKSHHHTSSKSKKRK